MAAVFGSDVELRGGGNSGEGTQTGALVRHTVAMVARAMKDSLDDAH